MGFAVQVVAKPAVEPVSLAELKLWCRVDLDDDDALLQSLGIAARRMIERTYDCSLCTQTLELTIDRFPISGSPALFQQQYSWGAWRQRIPTMNLAGAWWPERSALFIPHPPLQSVLSITYVAQDGTTQTVDPSNYTVDAKRLPGRIVPAFGKFWPFTLASVNSVTVQYLAGYGLAADVPDTIKMAIKIMVYQSYEDRRGVEGVPMAAQMLLMSEWDGEVY